MAVTVHVVLLVLVKTVLTYKDSFTEELLIKPLYSDQLYSHFQFTTRWDTELYSETCKFENVPINFVVMYILQLITPAYFQEP